MLSIIAFIIAIFGDLNWLSIGFFQYDLVAGLFGYQGSIFSRMVYIIIGISAIYLIFVIIKNKGRLTVNKLKKEEQPIIDKLTKKDEETIKDDQIIAENVKNNNQNQQTNSQSQNANSQNDNNITEQKNLQAESDVANSQNIDNQNLNSNVKYENAINNQNDFNNQNNTTNDNQFDTNVKTSDNQKHINIPNKK